MAVPGYKAELQFAIQKNFDKLLKECLSTPVDLTLKSVYFTVQKALPYMNDGGSVILTGSNAAHRAYANFILYGAAKRQ